MKMSSFALALLIFAGCGRIGTAGTAATAATAPTPTETPGWVTKLTLDDVPRSAIFFQKKSDCEAEVRKNRRVGRTDGVAFGDCRPSALVRDPRNVWATAGRGIDGLIGMAAREHCEWLRQSMQAKRARPSPCWNVGMRLDQELVSTRAVQPTVPGLARDPGSASPPPAAAAAEIDRLLLDYAEGK